MDDNTSSFAFDARPFRFFLPSRLAHSFAMQIMTTAVGWQVWAVMHDARYLAWIGLAVFLPVLILVVPAGLTADRFDRKIILACCTALEGVAAVGLLLFSTLGAGHIWLVYACLVLIGVSSAFGNPAASALVPNMLSKRQLAQGISLNTMSWQAASVAGPALGGVLLLFGATVTYGISITLSVIATTLVILMGKVNQTHHHNPDLGFGAVLGGFKFVISEPIVLGAISLDMFAVLLGGAVALMPIYASDILQLGSVGNGMLRAAPGIGAITVGLWLAKFGIKDHAGWWMFIAIAFSGVVVTVFGFSKLAWLSILMLVFYGAFDMISVYVRETLMQLWVPDKVRGRVNAVNNVFLGASNQLGEARAGFVAAAIGAVPAVVIGGIGTVAVAGIWAWLFPKLRDQRKLSRED
ncbi:MAG: MFS transporter [Aestuariivirga sp.]